jgi:serine/threonine protein kinase
MSPEQARGRLDELSPASDIYSLGATLYYMLTGKRPFGGLSVGAVLQQVQAGEFARPRSVKSNLPAALEAICLKAMAARQADRYATAAELAMDLERYLADEPVAARRETVAEQMVRVARRHRSALLVTVLMLALGFAIVGGALACVSRANQRAHHAMQRIDELQDDIQLLEHHLVGADDPWMRERAMERLKKMHQEIDEHFRSVPFFEGE